MDPVLGIDDLVRSILQFTPLTHRLSVCSLVSRGWQRCVTAAGSHGPSFDSGCLPKALDALGLASLRRLKIWRSLTSATFFVSRALEEHGALSVLLDTADDACLHQCGRLSRLTITFIAEDSERLFARAMSLALPSLFSLRFLFLYWAHDEAVSSLAEPNVCPLLNDLSLHSSPPDPNGLAIIAIAKVKGHRLSRLDTGATEFSDECLLKVASSCPELTMGPVATSDATLEAFCRSCPKLTALQCSIFSNRVTDEGLACIGLTQMESLATLHLLSNVVTDHGLQSLPPLRNVTLCGALLTKQGLHDVLSTSAEVLQSVSLGGSLLQLDHETVQALTRCKQLKTVWLSNRASWPTLDDQALLFLVEACPAIFCIGTSGASTRVTEDGAGRAMGIVLRRGLTPAFELLPPPPPPDWRYGGYDDY